MRGDMWRITNEKKTIDAGCIFACLWLHRFRNISRIMDCVGCEKCRMWGKLQTLGIGTALKILLTDEEELIGTLQRNEVIALVNTAAQFAKSVRFAASSRDMEFEQVVMDKMKWPTMLVSVYRRMKLYVLLRFSVCLRLH